MLVNNAKVARELKLPLVSVPPMRVSVADRRKMESTSICTQFAWKVQLFEGIRIGMI